MCLRFGAIVACTSYALGHAYSPRRPPLCEGASSPTPHNIRRRRDARITRLPDIGHHHLLRYSVYSYSGAAAGLYRAAAGARAATSATAAHLVTARNGETSGKNSSVLMGNVDRSKKGGGGIPHPYGLAIRTRLCATTCATTVRECLDIRPSRASYGGPAARKTLMSAAAN